MTRRLLSLAAGLLLVLSCTSDIPTDPDFTHVDGVAATVVITPGADTVAVGDTIPLSCAVYRANGTQIAGRKCSWSSLNGSIAKVTTTSNSVTTKVVGLSSGVARIRAGNAGHADTALVTVTAGGPPPPPPTQRAWHVAPGGGGTTCSRALPCDFATAISVPIPAGDTVYLASGVYAGEFTSTLTGTAALPIIVRQYPGDRAIIDGGLTVQGAYTWYWDIEVTTSATSGNQLDAFTVMGDNLKFINCSAYNIRGNGFGAWAEAENLEVSGLVLSNVGLKGSGSHIPDVAHGVYAQNASGTKVFRGLLLTGARGYGLHFYAEGTFLRDLTVDQSIIYGNGIQDGCNVMIGGGVPVERLTFTNNALDAYTSGNGCLWLGRLGPANGPATVRGNVVRGGDPALRMFDWGGGGTVDANAFVQGGGILLERQGPSATFTNNLWYGTGAFTPPGATDTYTPSLPTTGQTVMTWLDPYAGQAHVAVYNWNGAATATANVPGLGAYVVRTGANRHGANVATGTGPTVTLPLNGAPFGAFVVLPQ